MKKIALSACALFAVAFGIACGDETNNGTAEAFTQQTATADAGTNPAAPIATAIPVGRCQFQDQGPIHWTDAQILGGLMAINEDEVLLGQLAVDKGLTQEVRNYGAQMVQEHTRILKELNRLGEQLQLTPDKNQITEQIRFITRQKANALRGVSGAQFDLAFMDTMIQGHGAALFTIDVGMIPQVTGRDVGNTLATVRAGVQQHLEDAFRIQRGLANAPTFP